MMVLSSLGIFTNDEYYFSIPDHEKLENFMSTRIFPRLAHEDPSTDDVGTEPRNDGTALKDWLVSSAASGLRRLWEISKAVAKRDIEEAALSGDRPTDTSKRLTITVLHEMISPALALSMPFMPGRFKPSRLTMSKIVNNFRGKFEHSEWHNYVSFEDECRAMRPCSEPQHLGIRVTTDAVTGGRHSMRDCPDIEKISCYTERELEEMFELRAFGNEIAAKASVAAYRTLTGIYNETMYAKHGPAFRNATVEEIALVDRELHKELYGYCEDGSASLLQGLERYTGKGFDDCKAFKIHEQVPNTLPDRSIEFPPEATICNQMGATPPPEGPWAKRPRVATSASGSNEESCWKCGKSKMEHKRQRWCPGAASAKASGKSKAQPTVKRADPHQNSKDLAPQHHGTHMGPWAQSVQ